MATPGAKSNRELDAWPHDHPLVIVLLAVAAGIVIDRFWAPRLSVWIALVASISLYWAWPALCRISRSRSVVLRSQPRCRITIARCRQVRHALPLHWPINGRFRLPVPNATRAIFVLLSIAALAGAWHHCYWRMFAADDLGRFAVHKPQPICIEAIVVYGPRRLPPAPPNPMAMRPRGPASRFAVDVVALRDGSRWRAASGRVLLLVQGEPPAVRAGDRIRCFGQLAAPDGPRNPGGFDYAGYLRSDRILSQIFVDTPEAIACVQTGPCWHPARLLDAVRNHGNRLIEHNLDPQCAQLAEMLLLGERNQIDNQRSELFMTTGTIHLLVISGSHLVLVAAGLLWILRRVPFLPRQDIYPIVATAIVFYMLLVDAGPPVVRATAVVLMFCLAEMLGRMRLSFNSLAAAALVVLIWNPTHLFHVGAQLSFLSAAVIIWWGPRWWRKKETIERLIDHNRPRVERQLRKAVRTVGLVAKVSFTVWLLTAPLVLARFHLFTLVATLANVLAWLPMSLAMLSGYAMLTLGSVIPPLAWLFGWFCNANLWALERLMTVANAIPCGHFWLPGPADWWLWGFYGGLGVLAVWPWLRRRLKWRWLFAIFLAWCGVGFAVARWDRPADTLDCTFLSVGHGCAVVIESPDGATMLYDAGRFGSPETGARAIAGFLWSRGRTRIDRVVLSHSDLDHFNALPELLGKFSIGRVDVPPTMFARSDVAINALRDALESHHVPIRFAQAGNRWQLGSDVSVDVLHPPDARSWKSDNAGSLVISVCYRGKRILLTGDLESPGLEQLLSCEPCHCQVLLAPHHGSAKSNSTPLIAWCQPQLAIFSSDGRWNIPAVEKTYRDRGCETLWTNDRGAVHVRIDANGVHVTSFLEP